MTEIKKELKQENLSVKANAVSKLTYVSLKMDDISSIPIFICGA